MKKLYIGKLSFSTSEAGLREFFAPYEPLVSVKIITDKFSGESRGFGFVEIDDNSKADEAIDALNGASLDGRTIEVNEARPQTTGSRSSGNGRSNYNGSGRSGYGNSGRSRNGNRRSFSESRY